MLPLCAAEGIGVLPWSPLARGRLARPAGETTYRLETDRVGHRLYAVEEADRRVIDRVGQVAGRRGVSRGQLALAWLLHKPGVTAPIIGASTSAHLDEAVGALDLALAPDEIARLEEPYEPHPIAGHE